MCGKKMLEIFNAIREADQECSFRYSTIARWIQDFKNGRENISQRHLSGRHAIITDGFYTVKVAELLNSDRQITCDDIAQELGISHGSVHTILTECLNMIKIAAHWVPHCLSKVGKDRRVKICTQLLHQYHNEAENMLKRVVAIDETWIRSFEQELKRQSSEWHTKNSPRPVKFRRSLNNPKILMIFAYDINGVLTSHRVLTGQTANKEYYEMYIRKILRPAICRKRPELLEATPLILQDNAVNAVTRDMNRCCLAMGIGALPRQWECTIKAVGDYIEGL